jgi:hypothetical protein
LELIKDVLHQKLKIVSVYKGPANARTLPKFRVDPDNEVAG